MLASVNQTLNSQNDNKPMTSSTLKGYLRALKDQNEKIERKNEKVSFLNVIKSAVYNKPLDERNKKVTDELNDISEGIDIVSKNQESESKTFVNEQRNTLRIIDILQQTYDLLAETARNSFSGIENKRESDGPRPSLRRRIPQRRSFDMFSLAFSNAPIIRSITNIMSGLRFITSPLKSLAGMFSGKGFIGIFTTLPKIFFQMFKTFMPLKGLLKILLKGGVIIAVAVSLFQSLPEIFGSLVDGLKIIFGSFTKNLLPAVKDLISFLSGGEGDSMLTNLFKFLFPALIKTIAGFIGNFIDFFADEIYRLLGIFGVGKYGKESFVDNILNMITGPLELVTKNIKVLMDNFKLKEAFFYIISIFEQVGDKTKEIFYNTLNSIYDWFVDLKNWVLMELMGKWAVIRDGGEKIFYSIQSGILNLFNYVADLVPSFEEVKIFFSNISLKKLFTTAIKNLFELIIDRVPTKEELKSALKVINPLPNILKKVKNLLNTIFNWWPKQDEVIKKISELHPIEAIGDKVKELFNSIISWIPSGQDILNYIKSSLYGLVGDNKFMRKILNGMFGVKEDITHLKEFPIPIATPERKIFRGVSSRNNQKIINNKEDKTLLKEIQNLVEIQKVNTKIISGIGKRGNFNSNPTNLTRSNAESRVRGRVSTTPKTNPHTNNVYGFGFGTP